MATEFHQSASKNGVSITAYRGDGSALLAFDLDQQLATDLFAGFAVQATAPDGTKEWLMNRLNFTIGLHSGSTTEERQRNWTDSNVAPFQRFRWQHFPAKPQQGTYVYEVTPMYFVSEKSTALKSGPTIAVSLAMVPSDYSKLRIGFTRSYVSSQAYFEKFHNADIRQLPKTLDDDHGKFEAQYDFLGYTARRLLFDFLDECSKPGVKLDVFAYDFDEQRILKALKDLGPRLRIWLDDASLHNAQASYDAEQKALQNPDPKKRPKNPKTLPEWRADILEESVYQQLVDSAGAANVKRGHFSRFAHNKVIILRDAATGQALKVLTGSANFSVRGLYVQANNILVFDDPDTAGWYARVFDEVWTEKKAATSAAEFAKSGLADDWTPRVDRDGLPPFELCFAPHPKPKDKTSDLCSLKKVAAAIDGANSSVLFAVMELGGGGSVMDRLNTEQAKNPDLFWYGVTQSVASDTGAAGKKSAADQASAVAAEHVTGVVVSKPDGKSVLVPFAFLHDNVPPPFNAEVNGGSGQVIHNKFVVVDFNGPNSAVFTGSSNLAAGGEAENGDNLIGIYDRSIAVLYGVEAIRLIDHYAFRAALKNAKAAPTNKGAATKPSAKAKPLILQSPSDPGPRWWESYYEKDSARFNERIVFIK
jgi:phosphatidylserine/phosphatidylglycerophosphate/cardiolipin synthase-like enzyme